MSMQKRSPSPFASRSFSARTIGDYPSSLKKSLSRQPSYFSLTDPYLAKYFAAKAAKAHRSFSSSPSRPASRTDATRQTVGRRASKTGGLVTYLIALKTGSGKDNGTSARIFATLVGEHRKIGRQRLVCEEGEVNCVFDPGSLKKCRIAIEEGKDVGNLKYVTIENSGLREGDAWFLEHVVVTRPTTGERWGGICRKWLSLYHADTSTQRDINLRPLKPGENPSHKIVYTVKVHTGDAPGAGTDSNVFVTLGGSCGTSPKTCIGKKFQRGSVEKCQLSVGDLGVLRTLRVEHDNSGFAPAWLLNKVEVTSSLTPKEGAVFPCSQWLATDMGDGSLWRVLSASQEAQQSLLVKRYLVLVSTGDQKGASTDGRVFLTLLGSGGAEGREHLLDNDPQNFIRGRVDKFLVEDLGLGEVVVGVRVRLTSSTVSPDWFLSHVMVQDLESDEEPIMFLSNQWLRSGEGNAVVELKFASRGKGNREGQKEEESAEEEEETADKDAVVIVPNGPAGGDENQWLVTMCTSDIRDAGTDASVFVRLIGNQGSSERLWIGEDPECFQQGQEDSFVVTAPVKDLGELCGIMVGHDGSNPYPGWHLDHVTVTNKGSGICHVFPCGRWLEVGDEEEGSEAVVQLSVQAPPTTSTPVRKGFIPTEVPPSISPVALPGLDNSTLGCVLSDQSSPEQQHEEALATISYTIHVTLGIRPQASSRACLLITLIGYERSSPPLSLWPLSKPDLVPGKTEVYSVSSIDVGTITKLAVELTSPDQEEEWMVEKIDIHHPTSGDTHCFSINHWVGVNRPAMAELMKPSSGTNATAALAGSHFSSDLSLNTSSQMIGYQVRFLTADKKSAGTVGDVHLLVVGDKGQSKPFKFKNHKGSRFQRGQTDRFQFACRDVGQVTAVKVAHVISGSSSLGRDDQGGCWYLYQVVLSRLKDKHRCYFTCGRWLSSSSSEKTLKYHEILVSKVTHTTTAHHHPATVTN